MARLRGRTQADSNGSSANLACRSLAAAFQSLRSRRCKIWAIHELARPRRSQPTELTEPPHRLRITRLPRADLHRKVRTITFSQLTAHLTEAVRALPTTVSRLPSSGAIRGRYWDRTSDLFRVKFAQRGRSGSDARSGPLARLRVVRCSSAGCCTSLLYCRSPGQQIKRALARSRPAPLALSRTLQVPC